MRRQFDRLVLLSRNTGYYFYAWGDDIQAKWCEKVGKSRKIYISYDNDETGRKGAERVAKLLENTEMNYISSHFLLK